MLFLPRSIFFICCQLLLIAANAQTRRVDSLLKKVYAAADDSEKLKAIFSLCEEHQSLKRDTLDRYALIAKELSLRSGDEKVQAHAAWLMGNSYLRWGWTDSALASVEPYLKNVLTDDPQDRNLYFKLSRVKAMCYGSKSNFKDALSILYGIVRLAEKHRDSLVLGTNWNTIGSIALAREKPKEAMLSLTTALSVSPNREPYKVNLAAICTNLAQAYYQLRKEDSARYFIKQALALSREAENLNTLATALRVQSNINIGTKSYQQAEAALKELIEVRRSTNDGMGVVDDNLMLIDFYLQTGQPEKGIAICKEALKQGNIYEEGGNTFTNNINLRLSYFEALAKCYRAIGDDAMYQQTLENIIKAKDSFYLTNSAEAIEELKVQYEVQKKENKIIQQEFAITKKNFLFYGALLFSFLLLTIGWLVFRNNRKKQRLKMALMQQEEKRLAAEAVKEAEETERRRIAADLHDNLGAYATSIVSNVDYLKMHERINSQSALEELQNNAQSIVSQLGDTIWVLKKDALPLTAISDRIKIFAQRIGQSHPHTTINVFENIVIDHYLPPSHTFHLFQVVKEGIINAVKHSGGHLINVTIEGNDSWKFVITDDGKGMKHKKENTEGGNGMTNMRNRAEECKWSIQWMENYPQGTSVLIQPLTNN